MNFYDAKVNYSKVGFLGVYNLSGYGLKDGIISGIDPMKFYFKILKKKIYSAFGSNRPIWTISSCVNGIGYWPVKQAVQ